MIKKGNSMISIPIMLIISIFIVIYLSMYIINTITPFIYYQKLNRICEKYMFVIEKFGNLTSIERNLLEEEIKNSGFDISKIIILLPDSNKLYGELITFEISYRLILKVPDLSQGKYSLKERETIIHVKKNSFSKI
jgi:hypothetical protein